MHWLMLVSALHAQTVPIQLQVSEEGELPIVFDRNGLVELTDISPEGSGSRTWVARLELPAWVDDLEVAESGGAIYCMDGDRVKLCTFHRYLAPNPVPGFPSLVVVCCWLALALASGLCLVIPRRSRS